MRPSHHQTGASAAALVVIWTCCLSTPALAILCNFTVDDTGSAIQYSPADLWNVGRNCSGCTAKPDVTEAKAYTWHDSTHQLGSNQVPFASLGFTGSAVYVFCIITHSSASPDGTSDMMFFLDGQPVGTFSLLSTGQNVYEYNVLVYANNSIPPGTHIIVVQNGVRGGPKSLLLLDYMVYTAEQLEAHPVSSPMPTVSVSPSILSSPSSTSVSSPSTTTVVAAIVPSVIVLLLTIGAISFLYIRGKRRQRHRSFIKPEVAQHDSISRWDFLTRSPLTKLTTGMVGSTGSRIVRWVEALESPSMKTPTRSPIRLVLAYPESTQSDFTQPTFSRDEATIVPTLPYHSLSKHSDAVRTPTSDPAVSTTLPIGNPYPHHCPMPNR